MFIGSSRTRGISDLREAAEARSGAAGGRQRGRWSSWLRPWSRPRPKRKVSTRSSARPVRMARRQLFLMCLGMNPDILIEGRTLRLDL